MSLFGKNRVLSPQMAKFVWSNFVNDYYFEISNYVIMPDHVQSMAAELSLPTCRGDAIRMKTNPASPAVA